MDNKNEPQMTFDRKEAARMLGISVVTLDRQVAMKKMPHLRVGRRVLFTKSILEGFIEANTKQITNRVKKY